MNFSVVSILVLMDHLFGPERGRRLRRFSKGFNPCFDGSPFWTIIKRQTQVGNPSFNPCFDGSPFWTKTWRNFILELAKVSILVLMDHLFGHLMYLPQFSLWSVSILVLMDHLFGPRF